MAFTPSEEITATGLIVVFFTAAYLRGLFLPEHLKLEVHLVGKLVSTFLRI